MFEQSDFSKGSALDCNTQNTQHVHLYYSKNLVSTESIPSNRARHFVHMGDHLVYIGAQCRPNGCPWAQNLWLYQVDPESNIVTTNFDKG